MSICILRSRGSRVIIVKAHDNVFFGLVFQHVETVSSPAYENAVAKTVN